MPYRFIDYSPPRETGMVPHHADAAEGARQEAGKHTEDVFRE